MNESEVAGPIDELVKAKARILILTMTEPERLARTIVELAPGLAELTAVELSKYLSERLRTAFLPLVQ